MKNLMTLALGCLVLAAPLVGHTQKLETEVVKAFDGTAANCETKEDFIRNMRSGAYIVKDVEASIAQGQKVNLEIKTDTYQCQHLGGQSYSWQIIAPNESFEYRDLIFRDSQAQEVQVKVDQKDARLSAVSDDYKLLDKKKILRRRSGDYSTNLSVDLGEALTADQVIKLEQGQSVKLRLGVFKQAEVKRTIPGVLAQQNLQTQNWGKFYIFLNVTKDAESFKVNVIK